ncbi:Alternative oxidase 1a, mitochondrial [Hordeum vulgare]|nr:Alternative oxidase 1a, mitochondrial [Hordeum vulgare]
MDASTGTPFTPSYTRDSSAAGAAAAANPSAGSFGFASVGAPPSTGVARSLFMPPRMTSAAGGLAPAPAVNPRAPLSKLPIAARVKKGKISAKNKAAVGSGSSKPSRKRLAGRATPATATEAPTSSLVEPAADAQKVFEEMHQSVNDEAYMSTMDVGFNKSHWFQTNDMHFDYHEFEVDEDGEGIVDVPKGRGGNYTNDEDILLCNTWLQVSRDPSIGVQYCTKLVQRKGEEDQEKEHQEGRPFTLPHCYEELKDDEKWKKRDGIDDVDESNKRKRTIVLDHDEEEASNDDGKRSPTPNSVSYSKPKQPDGCKKDAKEKKKMKGDDEIKNAMEAIVKAKKEAKEVRKRARTQDAATEERRLAAEERKATLEERKVAMEERSRLLEWEKYLFFLDTSTLNEAQKEYINLTREEVLIQKRTMLHGMGGGGIGDMGAMGGFGAPPGGIGGMGGGVMGGMDGFGAPPGGIGGMSFASLMGGMGAPLAPWAACLSVCHDLANTTRDHEEEEEESASDDESEEEENEEKDEDEDEDEDET